MSNVLVTGAGVDKTDGIDFPLANNLLPEICRFIDNEGAEFEKNTESSNSWLAL